jgi:DNA-directed RNA polymerase subunit beta
MTPEEKLLRAIFGEKASDVRDTSLASAAGCCRNGRRGARLQPPWRRQGRARDGDRARRDRAPRKDRDDEMQILDRNVYARLMLLVGKKVRRGRRAARTRQDHRGNARHSPLAVVGNRLVRTPRRKAEWRPCRSSTRTPRKASKRRFVDKVDKLQRGDELPPGVMKMVKVFVAVKRKIQPGDKMAGRHGNKGVVSRSCRARTCRSSKTDAGRRRAEPARRASRMNVGQILETHLGWACRGLGAH